LPRWWGCAPGYLAWLPGTLIVGLGIGLTFPVLSAASVSNLPPSSFAARSAVNQTSRQLGGAVGVAVLVAIVGGPALNQAALEQFKHLWIFSAAMALASGLVASTLRARVEQPATAAGPSASLADRFLQPVARLVFDLRRRYNPIEGSP
jgi:hypothetical protein